MDLSTVQTDKLEKELNARRNRKREEEIAIRELEYKKFDEVFNAFKKQNKKIFDEMKKKRVFTKDVGNGVTVIAKAYCYGRDNVEIDDLDIKMSKSIVKDKNLDSAIKDSIRDYYYDDYAQGLFNTEIKKIQKEMDVFFDNARKFAKQFDIDDLQFMDAVQDELYN